MYLLVFLVILLGSTIVGGPIPDNTFLFLTGAVAVDNGLSMELLFVIAVCGAFAGYEINYWSGRQFGLTICRESCPVVLSDRNVRKALAMIDRFGPAALVLSRFMPVLNLPSFLAGVNAMEYRRYAGFNLISSVVWGGILLLLGYYFGTIAVINEFLDYLTDFIIIVMVAAVIFVLVTFARDYFKRNRSPE